MADITFVVTEGVKAGLTSLKTQTNKQLGNAAGTDDFLMPNDGKTVLAMVVGAAAKAITFVQVKDKYGRTETVSLTFTPTASKSCTVGPWKPELWNQPGGFLKFKPAGGGDVGDYYLAVRVGKPT